MESGCTEWAQIQVQVQLWVARRDEICWHFTRRPPGLVLACRYGDCKRQRGRCRNKKGQTMEDGRVSCLARTGMQQGGHELKNDRFAAET